MKQITLGCDPEFEVIKDGEVIVADRVLPRSQRYRIGVDGGCAVAELRPLQGKTAPELVKNLKRLFKMFKKKYPALSLSVKGDKHAAGAHIHFGSGEQSDKTILKLFDIAIGKLATSKSGKARKDCGYGRLSDAHSKTYGFEYRTPAAALFRKPEYVEVITRFMQAIYATYLEAGKPSLKAGQYGKFIQKVKGHTLDAKDNAVLKEFVAYKPTDENVIQYWA